eukprot:8369222-Heterocapsa_arctica.AAC.1
MSRPITLRFLSKSTKTAGQDLISSRPAAMMTDLARSHHSRGASRRPKRPFLISSRDPVGTPGRPSSGGRK